jgi:membrane associated rhomboid family serine protease
MILELAFSIYPVWTRTSIVPKATLALLALHLGTYLLTLPVQKDVRRLNGSLSGIVAARRTLDFALDPATGVNPRLQESLERIKDQRPFPPPELYAVADKIEAHKDSLAPAARTSWDHHYKLLTANKPHLDTPAPSSFITRMLFYNEAPLLPGWPLHMFIHVGLWDIFSTLLYLLVMGAFIENRLGARYVWVYLAAGLFSSAALFRFQSLFSPVILFGDSAGLSAIMGLSLCVAPKGSIKSVYFPILLVRPQRWGTFDSPYWLYFLLLLGPGMIAVVSSRYAAAAQVQSWAGLLLGLAVGWAYRRWPVPAPVQA